MMSIIKCKMCGGDLSLVEGSSVVVCEYCGSQQTVPTADNEKKLALFARANRLLLACEFDKAAGIYENIVTDFPTEAEAYWGLVLCRYGIEYVDDPATGKKIPTCHRSSFDSVLEDSNFEQTLENADAVARRVYRDEAKAIEKLRQGIIEASDKEEPYDIFICYKETSEDGQRTVDSVIAQEAYDALSKKGYRVFFSRISLEDKLGAEFEPFIFAALNSAKIMLVFGTDYEYYNAVWVKNEWSRFLQLMTKDKSKHLIPCYKDIDAYDMPKEFAKLQAQDMGKIGAMQDLLRGIDKLMQRGQETSSQQIKIVSQTVANSNIEQLLDRGWLGLEDSEWEKADSFFDDALNQDARCAEAYLGKLMAELKINKRSDLADCKNLFDGNKNYQKVIRFGSEELKNELSNYIVVAQKKINDQKEKMAQARKRILNIQNYISSRFETTVGLKSDGTVVAVGDNEYGQCDIPNWFDWQNIAAISTSGSHTIGLKNDGTVVAVGSNSDGQCDVSDWHDIVLISTSYNHTVGLKNDGTVVAVGDNDYGQCDVSDWQNIIAISAGGDQTVGLKNDGTVVAVGSFADRLSDWHDIVAISTSGSYTVGLKANGTVITTGSRDARQRYVSDWRDIVAISTNGSETVGLKNDGTVVAVGSFADRLSDWHDIVAISVGGGITVGLKSDGTVVAVGSFADRLSDWRDIVAISVGGGITVGLKSDGTVVAVGSSWRGSYDVSDWFDWQNIAAISTSGRHTVGLKNDGTVVAVGSNSDGQCDVSDWQNIIAISAGGDQTVGLKNDGTVVATGIFDFEVSEWYDIILISTGYNYTVGLKSDGTVVAVGDNDYGQCNVSDWHDIVAISVGGGITVGLKSDGTVVAVGDNDYGQCDVSDWRDIVLISSGYNHTVGLKSDGTVVAVGSNSDGRCDVSDWQNIIAISAGGDQTVGLKNDGTVVAVGDNDYGQCDVSDWRLFQSIETIEKEREEAKKQAAKRREEEEKKRAEQEHIAAEKRAEQERIAAEKRAEQERIAAEKRAEQERNQLQWRNEGRCSYCGGELKGIFVKRCVKCHREKDY